MYGLLKEFKWTEECDKAFKTLKECLARAPILQPPRWNDEFHVHTGASAYAIGAVLAQAGQAHMDFPITFASRQLNQAERNYSTTEREALAMIFAVKKFRHYLLANPFLFYVDHQALLYLVNKTSPTGRIARWIVTLLEFDFRVVIRKGTDHVLADHFSRLNNGEAPIGIDDDTPDAALFQVDVTPDYAESVVQALTKGDEYLQTLTKREARQMGRRITPFSMIRGRLYKKGKDGILRRCVLE